MQIKISTDGNIEGNEALVARVSGVVESALTGLSVHITRVEVHLTDENSDTKGGSDDMRCMMEARLEGRQPVTTTQQAATLDRAIDGAAGKLTRMIETIIGRQRHKDDHRTDPPQPGLEPVEDR